MESPNPELLLEKLQTASLQWFFAHTAGVLRMPVTGYLNLQRLCWLICTAAGANTGVTPNAAGYMSVSPRLVIWVLTKPHL